MNSQKHSVSVVITCYNHARYLGEAIESALGQTHPHTQVIVVDDGSKDNSAEVAASYANVRLIRQENGGVVAARNRGICEAEGTYVIVLDGDDRLLPSALETGVRHLSARPECAFVYGRCRHINGDGTARPSPSIPRFEKDHYVELLRSCYIYMPAMVMHRREVLNSFGGFDAALDHSCDYDLYLRITQQLPVYDHGEVVAEYREHDANMTRNAEHMWRCTISALHAQWKNVKGNRRYEEAYKRGMKQWQECYSEQLVDRVRDRVRARAEWGKAGRDVAVLLRRYPQAVVKHVYRKLYCTVFRGEA